MYFTLSCDTMSIDHHLQLCSVIQSLVDIDSDLDADLFANKCKSNVPRILYQ